MSGQEDAAEGFWGDVEAFDLIFPDHPAAKARAAERSR